MELINEKIKESNYFYILSNVLKERYQNSMNLTLMISYDEFSDMVKHYIIKTMQSYLNDIEERNGINNSCVIKQMSHSKRGGFTFKTDTKTNLIIINEDVVKKMYHGNILEMITIFHELNHFKIRYDLRLGKVNKKLERIAKEKLIDLAPSPISLGIKGLESDYYHENYSLISEEKTVEMDAINNVLEFCQITGISIKEEDQKSLQKRVATEKRLYQNHLRDFKNNISFNDYYLDFDSAFDFLIKYNPSWIEWPQINIEYHLDQNGQIKKRTKEELTKLLKTTNNPERMTYIQELIAQPEISRFEKSAFGIKFKIVKDNTYMEIANNQKK